MDPTVIVHADSEPPWAGPTRGAPGATSGDPTQAGSTEAISRRRLVLRRFRRRRTALAGLVALVLLFVMAYVGPLVAPWRYNQLDFASVLSPPSGSHWFGSTQTGA